MRFSSELSEMKVMFVLTAVTETEMEKFLEVTLADEVKSPEVK